MKKNLKKAKKEIGKKTDSIDEFDAYCKKNGIFIGVLPDYGNTLICSIKDGKKGGVSCHGKQSYGVDMYEGNIATPKKPFWWSKKSILEYKTIEDLTAEDFGNDDGFRESEAGSLDSIENYDGLQFGDVICAADGGLWVRNEDDRIQKYDEKKHKDLDYECFEFHAAEGGFSEILIHLGDRVFVNVKSITPKLFKAIKTIATLHDTAGELESIGVKCMHWDNWRNEI